MSRLLPLSPVFFPNPAAELHTLPDGEAVLFWPLTGELLRLDKSGLTAWRLFLEERTLPQIAAALSEAPGTDIDRIVADLRELHAGLRRRGFLLANVQEALRLEDQLAESQDFPGNAAFRRRLHETAYALALADGSRLALCPADNHAAVVSARFASAAGLETLPPEELDGWRTLWITTAELEPEPPNGEMLLGLQQPGEPKAIPPTADSGAREKTRPDERDWLRLQLLRLCSYLGREAQRNGGVLLNAALAERRPASAPGGEPQGLLFCGRTGAGKTTASSRLPPPWRVLCDDLCLVTRAPGGGYFAHPLPTWSRLPHEAPSERRILTQQAIPLRAVFVLDQAARDRRQPATASEAVGRLTEIARQASEHLWGNCTPASRSVFHRQRFENICRLEKALPVEILAVSPAGPFWELAE